MPAGVNEWLRFLLRRFPKTPRVGEYSAVASIPELLAQDALFQAMAGIEQHPHRDGLVGKNLDAADVARLVMVGDGGDGAFIPFEDLNDHMRGVGEQGATPAPRAERADRRSTPIGRR